MARIGPLVLFTKDLIDNEKVKYSKPPPTPAGGPKRTVRVEPRKKYEEEIQKQQFSNLKASREDFVVLLGDRIEQYHRKNTSVASLYSGKHTEEIGFNTPHNKPYVSVGGAIESIQTIEKKFNFPVASKPKVKIDESQRNKPRAASPTPSNTNGDVSTDDESSGAPEEEASPPATGPLTFGPPLVKSTDEVRDVQEKQEEGKKIEKFKLDCYGSMARGFNFPTSEVQASKETLYRVKRGYSFASDVDFDSAEQSLQFPSLKDFILEHQRTITSQRCASAASSIGKRAVAFITQSDDTKENGELSQADSGDDEMRRMVSRRERPRSALSVTLSVDEQNESDGTPQPRPSSRPVSASSSKFSTSSYARSNHNVIKSVDPKDPVFNYNFRRIEEFDDSEKGTGKLYWNERFTNAKYLEQCKLMAQILNRRVKKDEATHSSKLLSVAFKNAKRDAKNWNIYKLQKRPKNRADIWSSIIEQRNTTEQFTREKAAVYNFVLQQLAHMVDYNLSETSSDFRCFEALRELITHWKSPLDQSLVNAFISCIVSEKIAFSTCRVAVKTVQLLCQQLNCPEIPLIELLKSEIFV